jgi:hypothetical protein
MSNFVSQEELVDIFGENLLDNKDMLKYFIELLGKTENKPFECVGTIEEVNYVVNNLVDKMNDLPYLLKYYKDNYEVIKQDDSILTIIDDNHNLNDELLKLVKEELQND